MTTEYDTGHGLVMHNLNPIIPSEPMRNAVTKTNEHIAELKGLLSQGWGPNTEAAFRAGIDALSATPAPEPQPEVAAAPVAWRLALAKAFHDGLLMADDHEFIADSEQGKWCLNVVDFFAGKFINAKLEVRAIKCSICGLPMPEDEAMFQFHGHSGPCPKPTILDAAYAAAVKGLEGTSGDIGAGELERVVMAILAAITVNVEPVAWRVKHGGGFTIWNLEVNAWKNAKATNGTVEPLYTTPSVVEEAVKAENERLREALAYALKGLDMIHNGLMDPSRPRQAVGEVCAHFLKAAADARSATP